VHVFIHSIFKRGIASAEDIAVAAESAHDAQKAWARLTGPQRGDVLREAARLVLAHAGELTEQLVRETGSIRAKAQWEVKVTARELLEAAALGSQPQGTLTQTMEAGFQSIARRIPLGVVGIITPWNSPFILGVRAIGPALAMGNAVLLKPDVQSPIIGGVTFARLLEEAGLPQGLLHVLPGAAETGAALVKERLVNMVSFTGSSRAAAKWARSPAGNSSASRWSLAATIPSYAAVVRNADGALHEAGERVHKAFGLA
jgi:benzaldehyde dehydrogenase (NAD)